MKECKYQSHRLEWRDIQIEVRYCPEWLGSTDRYAVAHVEVETTCRTPLPITETGYVSHFTDRLLIEEYGGPVSFVEKWLEAKAECCSWKASEERSRQYCLL